MSLVKVKRFAQVTIPVDIRRKAHIEQGDFVEMSYETGHIILTPKRVSDKTRGLGTEIRRSPWGCAESSEKGRYNRKERR